LTEVQPWFGIVENSCSGKADALEAHPNLPERHRLNGLPVASNQNQNLLNKPNLQRQLHRRAMGNTRQHMPARPKRDQSNCSVFTQSQSSTKTERM
jgi:hypothetical protein